MKQKVIESLDNYVLRDGTIGCSLPDLRYFAYAAAGLVIVAALFVVAINRLRLW